MAECGICNRRVADTDIVGHMDDQHADVLGQVREYAISEQGETLSIERWHLERVPGENEIQWLCRMARNLGYITSPDAAAGIRCLDCGISMAPGFRFVQRLRGIEVDGTPVVEILCLSCGKKDGQT